MKYLILLFLFPTLVFSQEFDFMGLRLGQTQEEIIQIIQQNKDLVMAEDFLLTQLINPNPFTLVIKAHNRNNNMIQHVFIDMYEESSYQITIFLNSEYFSFYSISEKLLDKYGTAQSRTSQKVIWENEENSSLLLTLEFPSIIKITDRQKLQEVIITQNQKLNDRLNESPIYQERQRILNEL